MDSDGFSAVTLSLHGQVRGGSQPGVVGVVLVPEESAVLTAFREGELHLGLEASAEVIPSALYLSGSSSTLALGFPRYQVFLYNTTDGTAVVDVFAYLTN